MKLHINSALRRALLACYSVPKLLTASLTIASLSLFSPMVEAAVTIIPASNGQFTPLTSTQSDYIITNFGSGYIGGTTVN